MAAYHRMILWSILLFLTGETFILEDLVQLRAAVSKPTTSKNQTDSVVKSELSKDLKQTLCKEVFQLIFIDAGRGV